MKLIRGESKDLCRLKSEVLERKQEGKKKKKSQVQATDLSEFPEEARSADRGQGQ